MESSAVPVQRRWGSLFGTVAWGASTLAFVVAGVCLTYATVQEVNRLTRVTSPTPPEVATDVIVRNAKDSAGRRASFRVLLLRMNSAGGCRRTTTWRPRAARRHSRQR